jgi:membrane-bound ClpP family serine protease
MTEYVFHWPEMGVEEGEYVGTGEEELSDPVSARIVVVAGILAGLLAPFVLVVGAVVGTILLDQFVGLSAFGGSAFASIMAFAFALAALDVVVQRVAFSPVNNISGILGVMAVIPGAALYLLYRRQSADVDEAEQIAALAGESGAWRIIAARLFKRRPGRPMSDGGQTK